MEKFIGNVILRVAVSFWKLRLSCPLRKRIFYLSKWQELIYWYCESSTLLSLNKLYTWKQIFKFINSEQVFTELMQWTLRRSFDAICGAFETDDSKTLLPLKLLWLLIYLNRSTNPFISQLLYINVNSWNANFSVFDQVRLNYKYTQIATWNCATK